MLVAPALSEPALRRLRQNEACIDQGCKPPRPSKAGSTPHFAHTLESRESEPTAVPWGLEARRVKRPSWLNDVERHQCNEDR
jgi:hypothetical protein